MTRNSYHFERDTFEYQLKEFAAREIRFRVNHLGQTYSHIALLASNDDEKIAVNTVINLASGKTKHPQARTLFSIMLALGFEFDMVSAEIREAQALAVDNSGKVVTLKKGPKK